MSNSHGKRRNSRNIFKSFKLNNNLTTNLLCPKLINKKSIFSIKINSSLRKNLPNKWYSGKNGILISTSKTNNCLLLNKKIKNKTIPKKLFLSNQHINLQSTQIKSIYNPFKKVVFL
mmetsp:Transcript_132/g.173  ORF Transcript_132/g.173 Transcript_132/m.173 type:complete len:117 (+) Transcript_132:298-648(+)